MAPLPDFLRRPDRYQLQRERQVWRNLMPFIFLASLVGILVAASAYMDLSIQGLWHPVIIWAGLAVGFAPVPIYIYRALRGHFRRDPR